jgi:hypothetical protein
MVVTDDTPLKGKGKYKTIGELKKASMGATNGAATAIRSMEPSEERDYIDDYMFNTHYKTKIWNMGNLTERIKPLENEICYRMIMRQCFNGEDIRSKKVTTIILSSVTTDFIKELNLLHPSFTGTFIDYLSRRIISELTEKPFEDGRAWMILNDGTSHSCTDSNNTICKYSIQSSRLPICRYLAYEKTKDTSLFKSCDILPEIFITSLCHSESFGDYIEQGVVDSIYNKLLHTSNLMDSLINPLTELYKQYIIEGQDILLNPGIGGELDDIQGRIPSDADMVINDTLFDIKCVKKSKPIIEIFQLLGYASLLFLNKNYRRKINKIAILNLLQGTYDTYDISFLTKDNFVAFIKILLKQ